MGPPEVRWGNFKEVSAWGKVVGTWTSTWSWRMAAWARHTKTLNNQRSLRKLAWISSLLGSLRKRICYLRNTPLATRALACDVRGGPLSRSRGLGSRRWRCRPPSAHFTDSCLRIDVCACVCFLCAPHRSLADTPLWGFSKVSTVVSQKCVGPRARSRPRAAGSFILAHSRRSCPRPDRAGFCCSSPCRQRGGACHR